MTVPCEIDSVYAEQEGPIANMVTSHIRAAKALVPPVPEGQNRTGTLLSFPDLRRFENHADGLLNSWKEIAVYLKRGVRTVQRWEETLELPVHRVSGGDRAPVFAYEHEIDGWLRQRANQGQLLPPGLAVVEGPQSNPPDRLTRFVKELRRTTLRLEEKIAKCPSDLSLTEALFVVEKLVNTLFAEAKVEGARARVRPV